MLNSRKHLIPSAKSRKSRITIGHDEPVYLIRAKDKTSVGALRLIADFLYDDLKMCAEIESIAKDFEAWQEQYPSLVKEPSV